jgi:homocysteine S-methyltransferase
VHIGENRVLLLDGGIGTELERRGVSMSAQAWCGPAAVENAETLESVHRDYLEAGADVVTANTFAGARPLLAMDGFADRFDEINRGAVRTARRAIERYGRPDTLLAGSLSHRGPIVEGTARPDRDAAPRGAALEESFRELATLLAEEGCDVILLEMMYDPERMPLAFAAAVDTGLPVWAGFSARRAADGRVVGFGPDTHTPFEEIVAILRDFDVAAAGVMHTGSDVVADALAIVRGVFDGPLLAYPDSGYFKSPHWQFEDVIAPEELRRFAERWVADGVRIVGGCCGLSPEHIAALRPLRR